MLVFFDHSYHDSSFKTRLERQKDQLGRWSRVSLKYLLSAWEQLETKAWRIKTKLKEKLFNKHLPLVNFEIMGQSSWGKGNLTVDGYISKHGGIESPVDGKVYTSKRAYVQHLKDNDCVISDWSKGSNKKEEPRISKAQVREALYNASKRFG